MYLLSTSSHIRGSRTEFFTTGLLVSTSSLEPVAYFFTTFVNLILKDSLVFFFFFS